MKTNAPINPSSVLLGLKPISLCLPKATPAKYAIASFQPVVKKGKKNHHLPPVIATLECIVLTKAPKSDKRIANEILLI